MQPSTFSLPLPEAPSGSAVELEDVGRSSGSVGGRSGGEAVSIVGRARVGREERKEERGKEN